MRDPSVVTQACEQIRISSAQEIRQHVKRSALDPRVDPSIQGDIEARMSLYGMTRLQAIKSLIRSVRRQDGTIIHNLAPNVRLEAYRIALAREVFGRAAPCSDRSRTVGACGDVGLTPLSRQVQEVV